MHKLLLFLVVCTLVLGLICAESAVMVIGASARISSKYFRQQYFKTNSMESHSRHVISHLESNGWHDIQATPIMRCDSRQPQCQRTKWPVTHL